MSLETREKVGICIPTYNQAQFIENSITSALNQVGPYEIEVWVSDDASTDNTEEVMKRLCSQDKRIHYCKHPKRIGIAENRSWVLSQPDTEFVVNLDSDDILKKEFLLTLLPKLHQYADAGYGHSGTELVDINENLIQKKLLFRSQEYISSEKSLKESIEGMKTTCTIIIFRKKVLEIVNYTRNRHPHGSDYDLLVRIADSGYGNVYVNKTLCKYRIWDNNRHKLSSRIFGLLKIYEESIIPAFQKRGWSIKEVTKQKKLIALDRSLVLAEFYLSNEERKEIVNLLLRLGDSSCLRIRFFLYKFGLGKFFMLKKKISNYIKTEIKNLLMNRPL